MTEMEYPVPRATSSALTSLLTSDFLCTYRFDLRKARPLLSPLAVIIYIYIYKHNNYNYTCLLSIREKVKRAETMRILQRNAPNKHVTFSGAWREQK